MNKILLLLFLGGMMMTSCNIVHNSGYPHKIYINGSGGSKTIFGEGYLSSDVSVYEFGNATAHSDTSLNDTVKRDSFLIQYKWLTVKWKYRGQSLIVEANPNTTGKNRKMWIRLGMALENDAEVTIVQNAY